MSRYNCRTINGGSYRLVKFDDDLNVESVYELKPFRGGRYSCECFAGNKETCRHREMLPYFLEKKAVNTGRFLDHGSGKWLPAIKH